MSITLTADELARWERGERTWIEPGENPQCGGVMNVDTGERFACEVHVLPWGHDRANLGILTGTRLDPPVRWRDAVGPCPTCEGRGGTATFPCPLPNHGLHTHYESCEDCQGTGKLLTELRATCPNRHALRGGWADCPRCDEHGSVLVATVGVEVLPVQGGGIIDQDLNIERVVVVTVDGAPTEAVLYRPTGPGTSTFEVLALDPLPVPGRDFVIVLTEVPNE